MDSSGKLIMECILETKAATILEFLQGLRGSLSVTFEEGTSAAWLHDLLKPLVSHLVVCDPRKNALLKDGSRATGSMHASWPSCYAATNSMPCPTESMGVRTLKELSRSYLTITQDVTRVLNRIKALYRSWAIPCSGASVYAPGHRAEWLNKIGEAGVHRRAERLYQQLDLLQSVRQEARHDLLVESGKHSAVKLLRQIPAIGPIRAALLLPISSSLADGSDPPTVLVPRSLSNAQGTPLAFSLKPWAVRDAAEWEQNQAGRSSASRSGLRESFARSETAQLTF